MKTSLNSASYQDAPAPSAWVARFAPLIAIGAPVLDVAAGGGRHAFLLRNLGYTVLAVDRDLGDVKTFANDDPGLELLEVDLEGNKGWPLSHRTFAGIIVTNYLHRPILSAIFDSLDGQGVLIYETFALGNEAYGRPRNPDFLLKPGELLELSRQAGLHVTAYEHGLDDSNGNIRVVQRICATRGDGQRQLHPGAVN